MKNKKIFILVLFSMFLVFSFDSLCFAETVLLKNGQTVEGVLWEKSDKYVKLLINGVLNTFFNDEIDPSYFVSQTASGDGNETVATGASASKTTAAGTGAVASKKQSTPGTEKAPLVQGDQKMAPGKKSMLLYREGLELVVAGDLKAAEESFKKSKALAQIAPQGFDSFAVNGLRTCGDIASGVISKESGMLMAKAALLAIEKRFSEALKITEKMVVTHPAYAPAWHEVGMNYMIVGLAPKALVAFQKSLELEPGDPDSLFALGGAQIALGQFKEGKVSLEQAKAAYLQQGRKQNSKYVDAWMAKLAEKML